MLITKRSYESWMKNLLRLCFCFCSILEQMHLSFPCLKVKRIELKIEVKLIRSHEKSKSLCSKSIREVRSSSKDLTTKVRESLVSSQWTYLPTLADLDRVLKEVPLQWHKFRCGVFLPVIFSYLVDCLHTSQTFGLLEAIVNVSQMFSPERHSIAINL